MSKVKLTIIKDSSAALQLEPTVLIQELHLEAAKCAEKFIKSPDTKVFQFGKAVVYTHGVQAFVFEDVNEGGI